MVDIFNLCEYRTIELADQDGSFLRKVPAWCFGEWGAHKLVDRDDWGLTHLPSGLGTGSFFRNAESALAAMLEISKLRNSWAFISAEEISALRGQILPILRTYRAGVLSGPSAVKDYSKRFNGYE